MGKSSKHVAEVRTLGLDELPCVLGHSFKGVIPGCSLCLIQALSNLFLEDIFIGS